MTSGQGGSGAPPGGGPASYCGQCGEPLYAGDHPLDHADCERRLALEPPRYCGWCRRRMKVQVTPRGWTAVCVEHGVRRP